MAGDNTIVFDKESDFEEALIGLLFENGWERNVLKNPTEKDLIENWAEILFDNNRDIDRLNNHPLTDGEMQQIIEQINVLRTPLKLNGFINGKTVSVKRDNPDDLMHFGKEISLKIYDRQEIAGGKSRYQIVQQPKFPTSGILNDRRGDLMLLINGMPVFHIELKKSGVHVSQATYQIEKYSREGIFTGLFALVQIFVAMNPDETVYFSNPGPDGKFNRDFYFHWADFDNEPINDWKTIASSLLSIPMAHQLIGFYMVADNSDGVLKVMRSYQYYAANAISDRVSKAKWEGKDQLGGYIWHTTGSGKTMTSFKSAQLIANSKDADKVIFLMDRIELGTQSLKEYRGFAEDNEDVQATENTRILLSKLKSNNPADVLIVTSIQKMSNIKKDSGMNAADLRKVSGKRIVFIVDEAHRSTFGEMLFDVKSTFPYAMFFGFTGTPIHSENMIKGNTTADIFGNELHRYSIADGIRDKNVLGFDPYMVLTYDDYDVRRAVALDKSKAKSEEEAITDPQKSKVYYGYMNEKEMVEIEMSLISSQYRRKEHQEMVIKDISKGWSFLSHAGKFHALFATSSIGEAIQYYRLLKDARPDLKVTALFDPNIGNGLQEGEENGASAKFKEDGLVEIMTDYNERYGQMFDLGSHARFKRDIAARLAHKGPYIRIEVEPEKQIDILIVVDQMLTGFDSKWINTLYLDKLLEYQNVIQAFSRTNRLFGPEKPFGTIRYYRKPHTMEKNIEDAVKLYSGDKPLGLFVQRLGSNLGAMNQLYGEIRSIFVDAGITDMSKNPSDKTMCAKFAQLFRKFNDHLESAKIQGFYWGKLEYMVIEQERAETISLRFNENDYLVMLMRYKELFTGDTGLGKETGSDAPYDLDGHLVGVDTGKIDADYMNSRFDKYLKLMSLDPKPDKNLIDKALNELHKSFATLTQEEQKYANLFLHDIECGDVIIESGRTIRDYITEYQSRAKNDQIHRFAESLAMDENMLRNMTKLRLTEANLNEYGRFDALKSTVDKTKARDYFAHVSGVTPSIFKVNQLVDDLLRRFLLSGGFDI